MRNESRSLTWLSHAALFLFSAACIIPFILLITASLTNQDSLIADGYSLFPKDVSMAAYEFLLMRGSDIFRAYGVTIFVTVVGTIIGLTVCTLIAYPLSRKETPYRGLFLFIVFFSMLFHGSLVPTYLVYTQIFELKNTIWALIIPGLLTNGYFIMMMRVFLQSSIPGALIESAQLDGAGEYRVLWNIVIPLSTPVMATIGLFTAILYWNDWQNGMIFITNPELFSIQNLLQRIMQDLQFISTSMPQNAGQAMQQLPQDTVKMAMAVLGSIPILLVYPFFQKYFIKGIMFGAVKG